MIAWPLLLPVAVLLPAMLTAAWIDIRTRTIPNRLNLLVALAAIPWWLGTDLPLWPDIAMRIAVAAILFGLFAGLFALGLMGGGDVKMIAALALWLPLDGMTRMMVVMALSGGVLTMAMLVRHRLAGRAGDPEIPYGVAIATGGVFAMANHILTSIQP